jgi:phosphomannomutase
VKRRAALPGKLAKGALEKALRAEFGKGPKYNSRDGVRVDMEEGWIHVRASNTEPIVRIFAEAANRGEANKLADRAAEALKGDAK